MIGLLSACSNELEIVPIGHQIGYVGEDLRIPIEVRHTGGEEVSYWFTGPSLANLDRWTHMAVTDDGGEFQWTPTTAHVGQHQFLFVASTASADASRNVTIEILAHREAAPVFDDPPPSRAFDLSRDPCISFPVKVRDGDSDSVDIDVLSGLPGGAVLIATGPLTAELQWCPSPDQVAASEHWLLTFAAWDDIHDPVLHDFRAVLVSQKKPGCSGFAPEVNWVSPAEGEHVVSFVGYDVVIEVLDDYPLRDPPVLLYTTGRLEQRDQLDVRHFDVEPFRPVGYQWVAHIPSFVLATDEFQTVTMIPWVSDNDDTLGTQCDHRAEVRSHRFVAFGAVEAGVLPDCRPCVQSGDCLSGVCIADASGGRCVPECRPGQSCEVGRCQQWNAAEGVVRFACGDAAEVCDGMRPCDDDRLEDNDRPNKPTELGEDSVSGVLCERDPDFYEIKAAQDSRISVSVTASGPESGDVELHLFDEFGAIVAASGGDDAESAEVCVAAGQSVQAEVFSPTAGRNHYTLAVEQTAESCTCLDDTSEPDSPNAPVALTESISHQGTICPGNTDYFAVDGDSNARTRLELSFDGSLADLDMELLDPDGLLVGLSQATGDSEVIEVDLPDQREYLLRVFSYDAGNAVFDLSLNREPLKGCTESLDCDPDELCSAGQCRRVPCELNTDCPNDHICPMVDTRSTRRTCLPTCSDDGSCRDGETCKQFFEGSACYPNGSSTTGDPCSSAADCAGNRVCIDWPGGYCAAGGCDRGSFCDDESLCAIVDGRPTCVVDCWVDDAICERADDYWCDELFDHNAELVYGCFPQSR